MIIYKDLLTDDELLSDSYDIKDVGNGLWEVDCKMIKVGGETFDTGANASAEGEDAEDVDDQSQTVLDIAHSFQLQKVEGLTKKFYQAELKPYMKALVTKMKELGKPEEEIAAFQKDAMAAAKKILGNWDNYDVYRGSSTDSEVCMYVLVDYREDGVTPYATYWKSGFSEMKV